MKKVKNGRFRRIFAATLSFALIAGLIPATPIAQFTDLSIVANATTEPTGEAYQLLSERVSETNGSGPTVPYGSTIYNREMYRTIKTRLDEILNGTTTDTTITITKSNINKVYNVTQFNNGNDGCGFSNTTEFSTIMTTADDQLDAAQLKKKRYAYNTFFRNTFQCDIDKVMEAIRADCPLELCWYGNSYSMSTDFSWTNENTSEIILSGTFHLNIAMSVSDDYKGADNTHVDPTQIARINSAKTAAENIVASYASASDYDKLHGYAEAICNAVTYNNTAANGGASYGDPWQLVYVFDNDSSTNVVCEGYSKAFKYLCDLTTFNSDAIKCRLVTGTLSGGTGAGAHMWNVVTMENGKNYLADITNSDDREGQPDVLLLRGGVASSGTYTFDDTYSFTYDPATDPDTGKSTLTSLWMKSETTPDLLTLDTIDYKDCIIAKDGDVITGEQNKVVYVLDGASITLNNATIDASALTQRSAVICLGNATINVEGTCTVKGYNGGSDTTDPGGAGIQAAGSFSQTEQGKVTLTITGNGKLNATGGKYAAGIGSKYCESFGYMVITGNVTVNAAGGTKAAAIGTGSNGNADADNKRTSGDITISGSANIAPEATGKSNAAVIGCGANGNVHAIVINGGTVNVNSSNRPAIWAHVSNSAHGSGSISIFTSIGSGGITAKSNNNSYIANNQTVYFNPIQADGDNNLFFSHGTNGSWNSTDTGYKEYFTDTSTTEGTAVTRTITSKVAVVQHDITVSEKGSATVDLNVDKIQQGDTVRMTVTVPNTDSIIRVSVADSDGPITTSIVTNGDFTKLYEFKARTSDVDITIITGTYVPPSSSCTEPGNYYYGSDGNYYSLESGSMFIPIDAPTGHHQYDDPVWTWNGISSATAEFTCSNCGDKVTRTVDSVTAALLDDSTGTSYTAALNFSEDPDYADFASVNYQNVRTLYHPIVKGASLTMTGEIGLNFFVGLDKDLVDNSEYYNNAYVILSGPKGDQKIMVKDAVYDATEEVEAYKFTYRLPAKNIDDKVTLSFYMNEGDSKCPLNKISSGNVALIGADEFSYSVTDYIALANTTYSGDSTKANLLSMLDSLKTYGTYARKLFGYKTDEINAEDLKDVSDVTAGTVSTFAPTMTGTPTGVSVRGYTLLMESETSVRLYVTVTDGGEHTFRVNNRAAELQTDTKGTYLVMSDIPASKLSTAYDFEIDGCKISCSALSYAHTALSSSDDANLKNAVAALYKYSAAANEYFS